MYYIRVDVALPGNIQDRNQNMYITVPLEYVFFFFWTCVCLRIPTHSRAHACKRTWNIHDGGRGGDGGAELAPDDETRIALKYYYYLRDTFLYVCVCVCVCIGHPEGWGRAGNQFCLCDVWLRNFLRTCSTLYLVHTGWLQPRRRLCGFSLFNHTDFLNHGVVVFAVIVSNVFPLRNITHGEKSFKVKKIGVTSRPTCIREIFSLATLYSNKVERWRESEWDKRNSGKRLYLPWMPTKNPYTSLIIIYAYNIIYYS